MVSTVSLFVCFTVITFHSLEAIVTKNFLRGKACKFDWSSELEVFTSVPYIYVCGLLLCHLLSLSACACPSVFVSACLCLSVCFPPSLSIPDSHMVTECCILSSTCSVQDPPLFESSYQVKEAKKKIRWEKSRKARFAAPEYDLLFERIKRMVSTHHIENVFLLRIAV